VYWPCSQYEAGFVSLAHDDVLLERTRLAVRNAFMQRRTRTTSMLPK
jgi:glutamate-1-semialdehyde aminotransferase